MREHLGIPCWGVAGTVTLSLTGGSRWGGGRGGNDQEGMARSDTRMTLMHPKKRNT